MALSAKVGTFLSGTGAAGSTVAITGVGFQPKALICWMSGRTEAVDTVGALTILPSFGFAASSNAEYCISGYSADAVAASDTARRKNVDSFICEIDAAGANVGSLGLQSFDADGFTAVVVTAFTVSRRIHYLALGGDSITNVKQGEFVMPNVLGNGDITGVGFQPDCVLMIHRRATGAGSGSGLGLSLTIGAASSSSQRAVVGIRSVDAGVTMDADSYALDVECLMTNPQGGGAPLDRYDFVGFIADGFTLNCLEVGAANRVGYLALKGGNYRVDSLLTSTTGGATIQETGFGFKPAGVLFLSHCMAETVQDSNSAHLRLSIGAATGPTERTACAVRDEDAVADSNCAAAVEFDECYANINTSTDTIDGLMDLDSMDADGFTTIMDDGDPAAAFVWYVAFGPAAAGGLTLALSGISATA